MGIGRWLRRGLAFLLSMLVSAIAAGLAGSLIISAILLITGSRFESWLESLAGIAAITVFGLIFTLPTALLGMTIMCVTVARSAALPKIRTWAIVGALCSQPLGLLSAGNGEGGWHNLIIFAISGALGGSVGGNIWYWLWDRLRCSATLDSAQDVVAQDAP
jgi:hypothetical protein